MMRSLYSGVAGLKTHQTKMDVIGNNIANVNTVGFILYDKRSYCSGMDGTDRRTGKSEYCKKYGSGSSGNVCSQ